MQEPSVVHNTFVLERSYPKPPKTVFAAFADTGKKRRWFAEGEGHELQQFELDFRVGGMERLKYRLTGETPVAGMIITNESRYQDIVPEQLIVTRSSCSTQTHVGLPGHCARAADCDRCDHGPGREAHPDFAGHG